MTSKQGRDSRIVGMPMIRSVEVKNFRCFKNFILPDCKRINIIVGDSGSGKTALLESIFLAMGQSSELTNRFRVQRGLSAQFSGTIKDITDAFWGDFFYGKDLGSPVSITLEGNGPECRSIRMQLGDNLTFLPIDSMGSQIAKQSRVVNFTWKALGGIEHEVKAEVSENGFSFPQTRETIDDNFYFHANNQGNAQDNATRYSYLSQRRKAQEFTKIILSEFEWITDVSLEVSGGSPALFVDVKGSDVKIPMGSISSGVNKLCMYVLAMLTGPNSVLLIDEIENGMFHTRYRSNWQAIVRLAQQQNCQIFVTSHSKEMLQAMASVDLDSLDDLALIRLSHAPEQPAVEIFSGEDFKAGVDFNAEIR